MTNTYTATVAQDATAHSERRYTLKVYQATTDINGNTVVALISERDSYSAPLQASIADLQAQLAALTIADTAWAADHPAPTPAPTPTPTQGG